jgi:hypothetical protein
MWILSIGIKRFLLEISCENYSEFRITQYSEFELLSTALAFFFFFFFFGGTGVLALNSGLHPECRGSRALLLESHLQPILLLLVLEMGSCKVFAYTGLKLWFSRSQSPKELELEALATGTRQDGKEFN